MNMVMRGFVRVPSAPANTPHAKTHSSTLHLLAVAGCECIKDAVCDVWLREKTASWHRWRRAKIQLITANIRPLQRKAAQTTNMSSRREPRSKDLEVEKGKQGKGAGPSSRWKRPIGDRINRWNMLRKARMWGEAQMNSVAEPSGAVCWIRTVLEASFKGCLGSMFMSPAFKWWYAPTHTNTLSGASEGAHAFRRERFNVLQCTCGRFPVFGCR